jgi:hypothetical protein
MTQTDTIVDTLAIDDFVITDKRCNKCGQTKNLSEFHNSPSTKDGLYFQCKECSKSYQPNRKQKNRNNKIDRVNHLGGKCIRCDYSFPEGIDFHHIDPSQKEFEISEFKGPLSNEKLRKELQKCAPLCRNCHAEFHAGRFDLEPYLHKIPKFNENTENQDSTGDDLVLGIQISNFD